MQPFCFCVNSVKDKPEIHVCFCDYSNYAKFNNLSSYSSSLYLSLTLPISSVSSSFFTTFLRLLSPLLVAGVLCVCVVGDVVILCVAIVGCKVSLTLKHFNIQTISTAGSDKKECVFSVCRSRA